MDTGKAPVSQVQTVSESCLLNQGFLLLNFDVTCLWPCWAFNGLDSQAISLCVHVRRLRVIQKVSWVKVKRTWTLVESVLPRQTHLSVVCAPVAVFAVACLLLHSAHDI